MIVLIIDVKSFLVIILFNLIVLLEVILILSEVLIFRGLIGVSMIMLILYIDVMLMINKINRFVFLIVSFEMVLVVSKKFVLLFFMLGGFVVSYEKENDVFIVFVGFFEELKFGLVFF